MAFKRVIQYIENATGKSKDVKDTQPLPVTSTTTPSSDLEGVGDITIGVTEVAVAISGTPKSIRIQADSGNTGIIYIGKTGVLSDGSNDFVRLEAGDEITIDYDDSTNGLYAISDTASQLINVGAIL